MVKTNLYFYCVNCQVPTVHGLSEIRDTDSPVL